MFIVAVGCGLLLMDACLVATCLQEVTSGGCLQEVACRRLQDVTILRLE